MPGWQLGGVGVGVRPLALAHWHKFHHPSTHLSAVPPQPWTDGTTQPHLAQGRVSISRPTLIGSLVSVHFLLVPSVTTFLRNSLFSPAHFLPNS